MSKQATLLNVVSSLCNQDWDRDEAEKACKRFSYLIDEGFEDGLTAETVAETINDKVWACDQEGR